MTKTKRQLRAEAVERLKEYHDWEPSQKSLANVTLPIWPMSADMNNDKRVDALIDLLTDDEPPEGDAVSLMRECSLIEISDILHPNNNLVNTLPELADMVERDYVRREYHCKVVDDSSRRLAQVLDERDELQEQVDVLTAEFPLYATALGTLNLSAMSCCKKCNNWKPNATNGKPKLSKPWNPTPMRRKRETTGNQKPQWTAMRHVLIQWDIRPTIRKRVPKITWTM